MSALRTLGGLFGFGLFMVGSVGWSLLLFKLLGRLT